MSASENQNLIDRYTQKLILQVNDIDPQALGILKRLKEASFQAYLVGGGVRDLLVSLKPKDFDIATNALPQEVKKKVPYSFIIGRRFKLVHAKRGDDIYEIATFRRAATEEELQTTEQDERHLVEENFFGNIEEDSFRRDFTINSLYYDPIDQRIVDHCMGLQDIDAGILRMIGNPEQRLNEDPIRILRAIRLSQKLKFNIEPELRFQISRLTGELKKSAAPRRSEEWIKFFRLKNADLALMELFDLNIFEVIIPTFHKMFKNDKERETFLEYVRVFEYYGFNLSDTAELFSAVLAAFILATTPEKISKARELEENESFLLFCRDELGVFKAEVGIFFQAMNFINPLKNTTAFVKKGERRQRALVSHPNFELSLKLGILTHQLTQAEISFWLEQRHKLIRV
jgi:poly(A) polymerase